MHGLWSLRGGQEREWVEVGGVKMDIGENDLGVRDKIDAWRTICRMY
jgi:hypothetical protein